MSSESRSGEQLEFDLREYLPSQVAATAIEHAGLVAPPDTAKHTSVVLGDIMDNSKSSEEAAIAVEEAYRQGELSLDVRLSKRHLLFKHMHKAGLVSESDMILVGKGLVPSKEAQRHYLRLQILMRRRAKRQR